MVTDIGTTFAVMLAAFKARLSATIETEAY
jgi:hypothetical protein